MQASRNFVGHEWNFALQFQKLIGQGFFFWQGRHREACTGHKVGGQGHLPPEGRRPRGPRTTPQIHHQEKPQEPPLGGHEVVLRTSGLWMKVRSFSLPQQSKYKRKMGEIKGTKGIGRDMGENIFTLSPTPFNPLSPQCPPPPPPPPCNLFF